MLWIELKFISHFKGTSVRHDNQRNRSINRPAFIILPRKSVITDQFESVSSLNNEGIHFCKLSSRRCLECQELLCRFFIHPKSDSFVWNAIGNHPKISLPTQVDNFKIRTQLR